MAATQQNNNVIADLNIRLGVVTDDSGLAAFVKNVQKTIDKATYQKGTKKSGFSNNIKDLEAGVKRYRELLKATYEQAHKLSLTDATGGFKKGANGEILATEKAFKKLEKGIREVEKAMNSLDPTALKLNNSLRRARIVTEQIKERENYVFHSGNRFAFGDFKKAYNQIVKEAQRGQFDIDTYKDLKNTFNYIDKNTLTKRDKWDYEKFANDFEKNLHSKNFLLGYRKDVLSELLGLDAKSIKDKKIQVSKLKSFINDALFTKKFGAFDTGIQQGIIKSQNELAQAKIKETENAIKRQQKDSSRQVERITKELERDRRQKARTEEREREKWNRNSFSDLRYQYLNDTKNIINPFNDSNFKEKYNTLDKTKLSHNQMREYERMRFNSERIAQMERERRKALSQNTIELQKQNSIASKLYQKYGQLGSMVVQYFNLWAIKSYLDNILNITAEFDRQRRALGSLIDDQAKAVTMFNQIKNMALESPYTTLELIRTAKGLSAYDVEVKDLVKDTKMLGDVASATGVDIQRLVLAYGQVKTATWLRGQEVRQFTEAGVPILRALANRYSAQENKRVTASDVQERISNRQVSFEDVQASLRAMTEEGGKFYNMQETIAETTYGKIQKITDAWQQGFEQIATSGTMNALIHGFLDAIVKIAKNINGIVPHLLTIGAAMLVINQRGKLTQKYAEKELALITRKETMLKQQELWKTRAAGQSGKSRAHANNMAAYYGSQANAIEDSITRQMTRTIRLQDLNQQIQVAANKTDFFNKRVKVLGLTFKRLWVTGKMVIADMGRSLKAFAASNWITLLIMGLMEAFNFIRNIGQSARQLNKDLDNIEAESVKKTKELVGGLEKYARAAVSAADGTKRQEDALSSLAQTYADIIPAEQLSIENLRAMNGEYGALTKQVELYQKIQEGKEKRATIIESDKYKDAFTEDGIKKIAIGWTTNAEGKSVREYLSREVIDKVANQLKSEWEDESITNVDEYRKRIQEELNKLGYSVNIDDIQLTNRALIAISEIKKVSTDSIKKSLFGEENAKAIKEQERLSNAQKEEIDNAKTGKEFIEERNKLLKQYAETMSKTLGHNIHRTETLKFLMGEIGSAQVLEGKNIKKNSELYSQTLQTMIAMKNNFYGLYDGIDIFSSKSQEVLDIWKDNLITVRTLKTILAAGKSDPNENYLSKKELKDESKRFFENIRNNKVLQEFSENGYGITSAELEKLKNTNKYNVKEVKAYFNRVKKNDMTSDQLILKFGEQAAGDIARNREKLFDNIAKYLEYYAEGYEDTSEKNSGSGETIIGKWKREFNEWIGILDKARQHYKELGDLFFDETALNKTVKAYEKQFKMYEGQFMDIMKNVNITSLKEWISTEENYIKGLEAIITEVDRKITETTGKKDIKDLQEFKFQLSQKISTEQINNIKESIKRFMEEVERQMEIVGGRIDIWKNIFEKTSNTRLADMFVKTFSGAGSRDAIKTMKNGFEVLMSKAVDLANAEKDEQGRAILDNVMNMFNKDVIDFSAMENLISDPRIPIEVRSQMLKIFKEFKQANQQILESGLEFYQKTRTLEEKRVDIFIKGQQKINEITKMQASNELKDNVLENVLKGIRVQMAELELEAIKSSEVYLSLFNNIEHAGVSSLKMLRDQIEALKDSFKDDPVKLKALNSELKKIDDRLEPKQYKFSDMFKIPSTKELRSLISEIDKADKKLEDSRNKEEKLQKKKTDIENKREVKRNSEETKKRMEELQKDILKNISSKEEKTDEMQIYARSVAESRVNKEIDEAFAKQLSEVNSQITEQGKATAEASKEVEESNMKLVELESLRSKAIEQFIKRIEDAFTFSSNVLDFGESVVSSLQANKIFKGDKHDSNMMNVYSNDVMNAFKAVQEYNNAFKGVMNNALSVWKNISDAFADKNSRNAIQDKTPTERNTSAILELTRAIYEWKGAITGDGSMPPSVDALYKSEMQQTKVDSKNFKDVMKDGKMWTSMGLGAALTGVSAIASGDYRSAGKGAMSNVGSGLMSTGEPFSMAAGAALQLGSAIWDACDKIHDSDIEKAIENLQDKFDKLSDVITATNNKIRKSAGNEVIGGKRENINTQQEQVKNLNRQLELAKDKKSSSDKEIKAYEKRIKELKQTIQTAEMELFESILGSGIDEYMKNLVNIFGEAAKSGENTFKALKNSFGESLSSMVQDTIMTTIIKNRLQKFFEQVEQISKQGGMGIGMTDDIIATGLEAMQDVNNDLRNLQPLINQINTAFRVNSSTAGSLASGIKGMSEETAGQMSGYLIANFDRLGEIQKSVFAIEKVVAGNTASGMMTQFQQDAITHLAQIEANTLRNANKLDQFYDLINSMKVVNGNGSGAVYGIQVVN